jgi:hypothetical protein
MRIRPAFALVVLAISFALPAFAQEQCAADPETRQQIEAVRIEYDRALNKHDAPAMAALFTLDAIQVWDETGGGTVSGQQAIEKWYADIFPSSPPEIRRQASSGICNWERDNCYLGMELGGIQWLQRKDLRS